MTIGQGKRHKNSDIQQQQKQRAFYFDDKIMLKIYYKRVRQYGIQFL